MVPVVASLVRLAGFFTALGLAVAAGAEAPATISTAPPDVSSPPPPRIVPLPAELHHTQGVGLPIPRGSVICHDTPNLRNAHHAAAILHLEPPSSAPRPPHLPRPSTARCCHPLLGQLLHPPHDTTVCSQPPPHSSASGEAVTIILQTLPTRDTVDLGVEGYVLTVSPASRQVLLAANTITGVFHALQSLRQLLPSSNFSPAATATATVTAHGDPNQPATSSGHVLPQVTIRDRPTFIWRGMMLDVSRHMFDVAFIRRFIDTMALHKLNRFHWHLTDDQGWRLPVPQHPELTKTGAWRRARLDGEEERRRADDGGEDGLYGGWYSAHDIQAIVRYASERHITIVPEVGVPGHAQAAIASLPWLSCRDAAQVDNLTVWTDWGVSKHALCVCRPQVIKFVETVLEEVMRLFPGRYIHVGGDECVTDDWALCPDCLRIMQRRGLTRMGEMQAWFTARLTRFVKKRGRRLVGWDEVLDAGSDIGRATVMAWEAFGV